MHFEGFIETSRGKVFCKITGDNQIHEPVLMVSPGGPGFSHELYEQHSGCFAKHCQMLFFDPIGSGKSSSFSNPSDYTLDNFILVAKEIIEHFKINKIIILGTSYGSIAALNFALHYPDHVDKLILVGGAPSYHFVEEAKKELLKRGTQQQIEAGQILFNGAFKDENQVAEFLKIMSTLYSNKAKKPTGTSPFKATCSLDPLNNAFGKQFEHYDYRSRLPKINCPTIILVGEDDWINPVNQSLITHHGIKSSILHIIKGAGHSVAVDRPDLYQQIVTEFITAPKIEQTNTRRARL